MCERRPQGEDPDDGNGPPEARRVRCSHNASGSHPGLPQPVEGVDEDARRNLPGGCRSGWPSHEYWQVGSRSSGRGWVQLVLGGLLVHGGLHRLHLSRLLRDGGLGGQLLDGRRGPSKCRRDARPGALGRRDVQVVELAIRASDQEGLAEGPVQQFLASGYSLGAGLRMKRVSHSDL